MVKKKMSKKTEKTIKILLIVGVALLVIYGLNQNYNPYDINPGRGKTKTQCADKIDNDGDGLIDFPTKASEKKLGIAGDPGCESNKDNSEHNPDIECDDGIDNDKDNYIDYNDIGCASVTDTDETNCGDNVCEGGEEITSCAIDCGSPINETPTNETGPDCGNGLCDTGECAFYGCDNLCEIDCAPSETSSCTETDGGYNIYLKGTLTRIADGLTWTYTDYCEGTVINEYFCYDNRAFPRTMDCNTTCSNGACPPPPEDTCTDTDGGKTPNTRGTVSGIAGGVSYSYTDYCTFLERVVEYYCSGDHSFSTIIDCVECVDGECV